jgi:hypothetical protein
VKVFISHNKADKAMARTLAVLLVEQGVDVWFDEWDIKPGDSIAGGIEKGVTDADVFSLMWSENAQRSNWVGAELRAFIHRKVADDGLRIIPLMLDETALPALVADYRGFSLAGEGDLESAVVEMTGQRPDLEVARILQTKLLELTEGVAASGDPLPYLVCPSCASADLKRYTADDPARDDTYYIIECNGCGWSDWTQ